ncbi:MAG: PAS domain S-box protein [Nitrospirae bacterium]|nr:PAS domain S-box protein [Nitrospirota bacterium]
MFNRIPLTLKMTIVTVAVSVGLSAGLGYYSTSRLAASLDAQLQERLARRSVADRAKFDNYVLGFHQTAVVLSKQNSIVNYVKSDKWNKNKSIITLDEIPPWLPGTAALRLINGFTYAVLFSAEGRPVEVYTESSEPIPSALLDPGGPLRQMSRSQSFLTMIDNVPYIIASETVTNETNKPMATIMLAHALDDQFLLSIESSSGSENIIALIMGKEPVVMASNEPDALPSGTLVSSLKGRYLFTGKSFLDYGETDVKMMFASMISTSAVNRLRNEIMGTQVKVGTVGIAVLILSITLIMSRITRRIERLNAHISSFSKEQLGIAQTEDAEGLGGDQLSVLEKRYEILADEITASRDRLMSKTEELLISEKRTRAIVDNVPTGIIVIDINSMIMSMNPAAEAIFGYKFIEGMDLSFFDLTTEQYWQVLLSLSVTKELTTSEVVGKRMDGTLFPAETMANYLEFGDDKIIIVIVRDITKRKQYEENIRQAHEELEAKVKMRTAALTAINEQLSDEVMQRKRAEEINERHLDIQKIISLALDIALEPIPLDTQLERIIHLILSIKWLSLDSKGCIFLFNDKTGQLDMKAQLGLSSKILELCHNVPLNTCICGRAAARKEIIFTDALDGLHDVTYTGISNHGHYCVPILSGSEKTLGLLNLYVKEGHISNDIEIEFLHSVANTLAGIIERKLTEEKLRMSEDLFMSFMRNSPFAAFMKDETGKYVYANDNFRNISRMEAKDVIGKTDNDIFPMKLAAALRDHDTVVLSVNKTVDMVETFPQDDGPHEWLVIRFPIKDPSGSMFVAGKCIDTTAHKRVEEALKKTEEKYYNIINSTSEGFFELNSSYEITSCNDALIKMLKATRGRIIGRSVLSLVHNMEAEAFGNALGGLWRGKSVAATVTLIADDGALLHTRVNATPVTDGSGRAAGAFALITDITELVMVKNSLSKYSEELKRSNQDLQDFASVASHDLQEPLRKIIAFGDRLRSRIESILTEDAADYLQRMQGAASRMQSLIEELLNFSRITTRAKPFAPTDLNLIMRGIVSDLEERLLRSKGRVEFDGLPVVEADAMQMHQLFMNLTANGLKFHAEGVVPVVTVRLTNDLIEDSIKYYEIAVSDNGIGFDMKYIDKIFKPFQRLHGRGQYEGTGMGLAICDKIVKRHGGLLTVDSAPAAGTTFTVRLPAKRESEKSPEKLEVIN